MEIFHIQMDSHWNLWCKNPTSLVGLLLLPLETLLPQLALGICLSKLAENLKLLIELFVIFELSLYRRVA